jgi:hypothetical protein
MVFVFDLEDLMKRFIPLYVIISICFLISCSDSSSSSASGFSITPSDLSAPDPAAVGCTTFGVQIGSIDYSTVSSSYSTTVTTPYRFAVVYQSTTATGFAAGVYDPSTGLEIAKVMVYTNDVSTLPTTAGQTVTYSSSSTGTTPIGGVVVKYAGSGNTPASTPQKSALVKRSVTGNVSFSLTYVADNNYTVSSVSLPSMTPSVTVSTITEAATAQ